MLVFNVDVLLPARDWAESYEISNLEVTTSVGKKVDAKVAVSPKGAICLREVRKPSRMVGLEVTMRESDLNPDDSITLSGNLALHRSTAVELLKETLPTSDWELPGLRCSASWDANARVHVVETSATDLKEMTAFQVSALDLNNDWLYEFEPFRFAPCAFHQTSRKITGVEKEPSKIRIWKSLSIRKEEIAFKFEKIPVR